MDLLLTHGYCLAEDPHEREIMRPYPPLGLLYLSSHLKAGGYAVEVFDSTFRDLASFCRFLDERRPPVVGIYANLMTRRNVLEMMRQCKRRGATVVLGGPEPASYAEEYLRRGADVVVAGEGELTLEELLSRLLASESPQLDTVAGIQFLAEDGSLTATAPRGLIEDLDAQPLPDREAIDLERYITTWRQHHGLGAVSLITARGCPYECQWCSHSVFGRSHRRRSPEATAEEVALLVRRWRPDMLWYADDVFTIHHRWLYAYADELQRRDLRLPFETISREDRLDEEVVRTLAEMGCRRLWIGAESGSQAVLDAMQRRTSAERTQEMIRLVQRHGIEAGTFIMVGYDGETMADIEATVAHLKAALPDQFLTTVAYPIKGTPYYEAVEERILPLASWEEGSDRDLTVAGRHSRRFYRHAIRWMVNAVALHETRRNGTFAPLRAARALINATAGRLGMYLTRHEIEGG